MKTSEGYVVYWEDDDYNRLLKTQFSFKPSSYTVNPIAKWKPIVAAEKVKLKAGVPTIVRIKKVVMPKNCMCSPLKIMRNGLGAFLSFFVTGLPKGLESERVFDKIVFLPAFDGEIQVDDLLGILLVYYVDAGILGFSRHGDSEEETEKVRFVYWKDGKLVREMVDVTSTSYFQSFVYDWMPIVAAEDVEVKKGKLVIIKTESFQAPGNTVFDSLFVMRNAMGDIIDVFRDGKPRKVETTREISKVLFLPVRDGWVLKGDFLNAAALHHIVVDKPFFKCITAEAKANLVYLENGDIKREEVQLDPYGHYEGTAREKLELLVADESVNVKKGEVASIKIKDLVLKPGTVVAPLGATMYAMGIVLDVYGTGKPKKIENKQRITHALFLPVFDGKVKEGEIIGILRMHNVEVTKADKLTKVLEKIADKFSMSPGQFATSSEWPHLWHK